MTTKISNLNLKQFFIKELALPYKKEIKDLSFFGVSNRFHFLSKIKRGRYKQFQLTHINLNL